jgi:hypothetical protein
MATKTDPTGTLAARYLELLSDEGYRPKLDDTEAGDRNPVIRFKSEGQKFVVLVDEDDEGFFALGLSYELGDVDLVTAKDRANELNEQLKAVKVIVSADDRCVRCHVEAFLDAPATVPVLERSIGALRNAAASFFEPARRADQLDA